MLLDSDIVRRVISVEFISSFTAFVVVVVVHINAFQTKVLRKIVSHKDNSIYTYPVGYRGDALSLYYVK